MATLGGGFQSGAIYKDVAAVSADEAASSAAAALVSEAAALVSEQAAGASEAAAEAAEANAVAAAAAAAEDAGDTAADAVTCTAAAAAALVSEEAAEDALLDISKLYLGPKTANPTLDNEGEALQDGAWYFNSTATTARVWNDGGSSWHDITQYSPSIIAWHEHGLDAEADTTATGGVDLAFSTEIYSRDDSVILETTDGLTWVATAQVVVELNLELDREVVGGNTKNQEITITATAAGVDYQAVRTVDSDDNFDAIAIQFFFELSDTETFSLHAETTGGSADYILTTGSLLFLKATKIGS